MGRVSMMESHTSGAGRRAPLSSAKAIVFATAAVLLAAIPAFVAAGFAASLLPTYGEHRHAAYIATTLAGWGALSTGLVALTLRLRHGANAGLRLLDLALAGASLLVLGAWVFSIYQWSIAKFGYFDNDAIGGTTLLWPLLVIFVATLLPLVRGRRPVLLILACIGPMVLAVDIVLAAAGALRDGSVSMWGTVAGVLYFSEMALLLAWFGVRTRSA